MKTNLAQNTLNCAGSSVEEVAWAPLPQSSVLGGSHFYTRCSSLSEMGRGTVKCRGPSSGTPGGRLPLPLIKVQV